MIRKLTAAVAASALLVATPAFAQAAQPVAAPAAETVSADNALAEERGLMTYVLGAVVLGLVIWGIIEVTGGDDDEPVSP